MKQIGTEMQKFVASLPPVEEDWKSIENAVIVQAQSGDKAALDRAVTNNLRFAFSLAVGYCLNDFENRLEIDDFIAEGFAALVPAVMHYDPQNDSGADFRTYAKRWIRTGFKRARRQGDSIPESEWNVRMRRMARNIQDALIFNYEPAEAHNVLKKMGLEETKKNLASVEAWLAPSSAGCKSLDEKVATCSDGTTVTLADCIEDAKSDFQTEECKKEQVMYALHFFDSLKPLHREVMLDTVKEVPEFKTMERLNLTKQNLWLIKTRVRRALAKKMKSLQLQGFLVIPEISDKCTGEH